MAAGYSSRMGKIKPLLPIGNVTVLERVISAYFAGGIDNIYLVLGHYQDEIKAALPYKNQIKILYNPDYPTGMFSSLRLGVNTIGDTADAFLMTPADYPLIDPKTISDIINCYKSTKSDIICPVFDGETGHPCLFSMKYKDVILNNEFKNGLRSLIEQYISSVKYLKSGNPCITIDIDTKEDYEQILHHLKTMPLFWFNIANDIIKTQKTPENIVEHGKTVAIVSQIIASALINKGYDIDLDLLIAAALLHDIKRTKKNHAKAGCEYISSLGYPTLGKIISSHMGEGINDANKITEKEILYIADKMVNGTSIVSIQERFSYSYDKYNNSEEIISNIQKKEEKALAIKYKIECIISQDLDYIIKKDYYE